MTDAQGKEEGICAGPGLSHEPPWDGVSTHTHKDTDTRTQDGVNLDKANYMLSYITARYSVVLLQ